MYNRYIGNTGKFVRVEDAPVYNHPYAGQTHAQPSPPAPPPPLPAEKNNPPLGGLLSGLGNLFGGSGKGLFGGSGGGLFGGSGGGMFSGLHGMLDNLPFGLDIGDVLLFLLLLFLFLESGDEEFIIILAIIAINLFRDR